MHSQAVIQCQAFQDVGKEGRGKLGLHFLKLQELSYTSLTAQRKSQIYESLILERDLWCFDLYDRTSNISKVDM